MLVLVAVVIVVLIVVARTAVVVMTAVVMMIVVVISVCKCLAGNKWTCCKKHCYSYGSQTTKDCCACF